MDTHNRMGLPKLMPESKPHSPLDQAPGSHFPARDPGSQNHPTHTPDGMPRHAPSWTHTEPDMPGVEPMPGGGISIPAHYQIGHAVGQALGQALIAQRDHMIYQQLRAQGIVT